MSTCEETLNLIKTDTDKIRFNRYGSYVYNISYSSGSPIVDKQVLSNFPIFDFISECQRQTLFSHVELHNKMDSIQSDLSEIKSFLGIN